MTKKVIDSTLDQDALEALLKKEESDLSQTLNLDDARKARYQKQLEEDLAIELEEIAPQPINVTFTEYQEKPLLGPDGQQLVIDGEPQTSLVTWQRTAIINSHVPVELLAEAAILKRRMVELAKAKNAEEEMFTLYTECVLKVWRLSEPKMSYARLKRGLKFDQIRGLFARFFGKQTA